MTWKVETDNQSLKIDAYQLIQSLLSSALSKHSSSSGTQLDTKLLCKVYIHSFLRPMIEMTTIEKIIEISFTLGRNYEKFLNNNNVSFSPIEKEHTDS